MRERPHASSSARPVQRRGVRRIGRCPRHRIRAALHATGRRRRASIRSGRPSTRYGPGNRGLDYATARRHARRAVADGTVTFAGSGRRHSPRHGAARRRGAHHLLLPRPTSTSRSASACDQGQRVGTTVGPLHLGARRGDAYFDPPSLFDAGPPQVRLVPFDDPPGSGAGGERSAISQLIGGLGTVIGGGVDGAGAVGRWLRDEGRRARRLHGALRQSLHVPGEHARRFPHRLARRGSEPAAPPNGRAPRRRSRSRRPRADASRCWSPGWAPTAKARRSMRCAPQRSATHGADVLRFSYAGGRVPDPTDGFPSVPTTRYDASATQADLRGTAARLADLVEAMVARGRPACRSTCSPTRRAGWSSAWR